MRRAVVACIVVLGCARQQPRTDVRVQVGTRMHEPPRQELPARIVTPSGRVLVPGERDRNGVVLPLDVPRPEVEVARPRRPDPTRPRQFALDSGTDRRLGPDDGHTENETSADVAGSTVIAGWNSFTDSGVAMGVARSSDGGVTWSGQLLGGHETTSDPAVRAAGGGVWYYAYLGRDGSADFEVYVRRSRDDGVTWEPPVAATDDADFDDKCYLAARGDELLVAYAEFDPTWPPDIRAVRSTDGGLSFDADRLVSPVSQGGNGPVPAIAPDGTYHVVWRDSFGDGLWIASSTDRGETWRDDQRIADQNPLPSTLPGGFRTPTLPALAVAPGGELLVVWHSQPAGDPDILAVRSTDGGLSWSAPERINDDPPGPAQFLPWVTFDDTGVAHAVWYDRRNDPSAVDLYHACSQDRGATWDTNDRVTAAGFIPVLPWETGAVAFIGDYNAVVAGGSRALAIYQDARRGEQDVWVSDLTCTKGPCRVDAIAAIAPLLAARDRDDVRLSWPPDGNSGDGYNVHRVSDKHDLPACAGCGPASQPVAGCVPTGALDATSCTDPGVVRGAGGELLLYQVRGVCGGTEASR